MKLSLQQMSELNGLVNDFKNNTGIDLDIEVVLTNLGTRLATNMDFRDAFIETYKEVLNDQVAPGVMMQIKNGNVIKSSGFHLEKVMEALWDDLAPESYEAEDENFTKEFKERKKYASTSKRATQRDINDLGKKIEKLEKDIQNNEEDPEREKKEKEIKDLKEEMKAKSSLYEKIDEGSEKLNSSSTLYAHMIRSDYEKYVREAFRNNAHLAGDSLPSYKIKANYDEENLELNRAVVNSQFTTANHEITWDEYSVEKFHNLIGTLSESYMTLHERYNKFGFFKKIFNKEARTIRGEMNSCIAELNELQDRMIDHGMMNERIDVKKELKEKAETIREMPEPISKMIEKSYETFTMKPSAKASKNVEEPKKNKIIEKENVKRIEIEEVRENKENIIPIDKKPDAKDVEAKENENENENDLFADF